jgi:hypothetical protein
MTNLSEKESIDDYLLKFGLINEKNYHLLIDD